MENVLKYNNTISDHLEPAPCHLNQFTDRGSSANLNRILILKSPQKYCRQWSPTLLEIIDFSYEKIIFVVIAILLV
jgi:hypothetical protein